MRGILLLGKFFEDTLGLMFPNARIETLKQL